MFHQLLQNRANHLASVIGVILAGTILSSASATEPVNESAALPAAQVSAYPLSIDLEKARQSVQWLASWAIDRTPRKVHGDKDWGQTKQVWAGVKVHRDGFRLKTKRRYRDVEHGRWIRYEVALPAVTAANPLAATIHQVQPLTNDESGDPRWKITSSIIAPMRFTAQVQRWNRGVKLFSVTVTGQMQVRMRSSLSVGFYVDHSEAPPALVVDPRMHEAHLFLDRFEVDRISNIGGDVAEGWGEVIQEVLVERLIKKQNERLVAQLNQSIDKERDDLRISISDWFDSWRLE